MFRNFGMGGKDTIRSVVLKRINEKLDAVEEQYDNDCKEIDAIHSRR